MSSPYIPPRDVDLLAWGQNFTDLLTLDPNRYGIDTTDAATLQSEFDDFKAAMVIVSSPSTKTAAAVAHKNATRALFLIDARFFAQYIRNLRGVTNEDKTALGLTIPDPVPTPVPPPSVAPDVSVLGIIANQFTMRARNPATPTSNAKPQGVTQMIVYGSVTVTPQTEFNAADPQLIQLSTKSPFLIDTSLMDAGKYLTVWVQYANRKGQVGPLSTPVSAIVQH